jgi:hypothetical protein
MLMRKTIECMIMERKFGIAGARTKKVSEVSVLF